MSFFDDRIDGLLRAFRADEARIDHSTRARIWDQICDEAPDAPTALDTLDRGVRVRPLRPPHRAAWVATIAAAVLVLLAVAGLAVRSGPSDPVTAGPSTTIPIPRDLEELADRVAVLPTTVLGETESTRYTYRRGVRTLQGPTSETVITREERWVDRNGRGREVVQGESVNSDRDNTTDQVGAYKIGFLPPLTAIRLPDEAGTVLTIYERSTGPTGPGTSLRLVDLLTYTGLPAPARAGALRALDRLDFEPVPGADLGPNLWRVEGSGPQGSTLQADFDLRTGEVVAMALLSPGSGIDRLTDIRAELRPDTQDS